MLSESQWKMRKRGIVWKFCYLNSAIHSMRTSSEIATKPPANGLYCMMTNHIAVLGNYVGSFVFSGKTESGFEPIHRNFSCNLDVPEAPRNRVVLLSWPSSEPSTSSKFSQSLQWIAWSFLPPNQCKFRGESMPQNFFYLDIPQFQFQAPRKQ